MEYDRSFYDTFDNTTRRAAEIILPYVIEALSPKSVIDFGCGEGMWLSVINQIDPTIEIQGVDGEYVCINELKIDERYFYPSDLTKPIDLRREYDLAMSLEVGEHMEEEFADIYVENICRHSNRILFSAAIPYQGGIHHVNEKWQSYWINKFKERGYFTDYTLRNFFWNDEEITPWRRQNLLFFSKNKKDISKFERFACAIYDVVHPELYLKKIMSSMVENNPKEIYCTIDLAIKRLIDKGINEFVICPYGNHGFLCKEILNNKYKIQEIMILDNKLSKLEPKIYPCSRLNDLQGNYYVLENSGSQLVRRQLKLELQKYIPEDRIISIFESE